MLYRGGAGIAECTRGSGRQGDVGGLPHALGAARAARHLAHPCAPRCRPGRRDRRAFVARRARASASCARSCRAPAPKPPSPCRAAAAEWQTRRDASRPGTRGGARRCRRGHDRRRRHGRRPLVARARLAGIRSTYNVTNGSTGVDDTVGHGTFVASLAAGFGGQAHLMVVQANRGATFSDVDEAAGIVWAVDHGARIVNLSLSGSQTSATERAAVRYATKKGVLLVAAAGNGGQSGNRAVVPGGAARPRRPRRRRLDADRDPRALLDHRPLRRPACTRGRRARRHRSERPEHALRPSARHAPATASAPAPRTRRPKWRARRRSSGRRTRCSTHRRSRRS